MNVVATPAQEIPRTSSQQALTVVAAELDAFLQLLRALDPDDWSRPTDCTGWTVQDVVAHVVGQWEGAAKPWVLLRRHRVGHRRYPDRTRLNAFTQQQIDDLGGHPPATLIDMLATIGPKAVRAVRRTPALIRRLNGSRLFPEDPLPDPRLGYIFDVIAARDTWMHRVDVTKATGRPMTLGTHDREIVAQVVLELGRSWTAPPLTLDLTGPAGGSWSLGQGASVATIRADTIEFLRTLSGRHDNPALQVDGDPGAATALATARVVF